MTGKFYSNIEEDPRDNIESDEKISLAGFAGYNSQKTMAPKGVKMNEAKMTLDGEKVVKNVCSLVMKKVLEIRHKKTLAHAVVEAKQHQMEDYEKATHVCPEEEHVCPKKELEVPKEEIEPTHSLPPCELVKSRERADAVINEDEEEKPEED